LTQSSREAHRRGGTGRLDVTFCHLLSPGFGTAQNGQKVTRSTTLPGRFPEGNLPSLRLPNPVNPSRLSACFVDPSQAQPPPPYQRCQRTGNGAGRQAWSPFARGRHVSTELARQGGRGRGRGRYLRIPGHYSRTTPPLHEATISKKNLTGSAALPIARAVGIAQGPRRGNNLQG